MDPLAFPSAEALADAALAALLAADIDLRPGLSPRELQLAEERVGCMFPDDLRHLLGSALPVGERFPTWRELDSAALDEQLNWPVDGILFDVEHDDFWRPGWPTRPDDTSVAVDVARSHLAGVPRLIPVFAHRYLPSEPPRFGNPVLSVYQTDVIYYGTNLAEYVENEFVHHQWRAPGPTPPLPFWSYLLDNDV